MKITKKWLQERGAGQWPWEELADWFPSQKETNGVKIIKTLIAENKFSKASWFIIHQMNYKQYLSYAVFSIQQVMDIYEKKYPEDKSLRKTIKAVNKCINDPSKENRKTAQAVGSGYTYINGYAAEKVGSAVRDIVTAAAHRIAPAAGVAVLKACKAGGKEVSTRIFNYGIKLLEAK
ncbi:MAG: hypothetical protein ABIA97_00655 [Candidatus Omnitrophota bacterium]